MYTNIQDHTTDDENNSLQDHPLAELFPLMAPADLAALAENIRTEGLKAPITLHEGQILDGRNRWRACRLAGVAPRTREFPDGQDPLAFVLAANLHRRHLTESQRAMVAAKIAQLPRGRIPENKCANLHIYPTMTEAAKQLSVSRRLVNEAKVVTQVPDQARAVEAGEKSVHAAIREIKSAQAAPEIVRGDTGYPIPEELVPLWNRKSEVVELLKHISRARGAVRAASERPDQLYAPTNLSGVLSNLNDAYTSAHLSVPYAVCCTCQGRVVETCRSCKGRRFVSKHHFDRCVPVELKEIRAKSCG
jgi:hypothetical protein